MKIRELYHNHKLIYITEHKQQEQQTIIREVITKFDTKLPTSPGLCLSGGGFFIYVQSSISTLQQCHKAKDYSGHVLPDI
jgi:hypothetical protein